MFYLARLFEIFYVFFSLLGAGGPKAGVSNERFSAQSQAAMQTWHPHSDFVSIRLPPSKSRITVFPGGNMKISNV